MKKWNFIKEINGQRLFFVLFLVMIAQFAPLSSHAGTFDGAMARTKYTVFSADINGDGAIDVLMRATPDIIMLPLDDIDFPVPLPTPSPTFILLSGSGDYALIADPPAEMLSNPAWRKQTHTILFADVLGNKAGSVFLRPVDLNSGPGFVVAMSAETGALHLVQQLTIATIGVNLAYPYVINLNDQNGDGRSDLTIVNNNQTDLFLADELGVLHYQAPPVTTPPPVVTPPVVVPKEPEIVIVGTFSNSKNLLLRRGFRWSTQAKLEILNLGAGATMTEAWGVSPNGKFVVGSSTGAKVTATDTGSSARWLTVATSWDTDGGYLQEIPVYLNRGADSNSVAWRTTDSGTRIEGESDYWQLKLGVLGTVWDEHLHVEIGKEHEFSANLLVSADGTIALENSNGKAGYRKDGKYYSIDIPKEYAKDYDTVILRHVVIIK